MKTSSKEVLEKVSNHCFNQLTFYTFNTSTLKVNKKYREGRLAALKYINDLSFYFLNEEKNLKIHFKTQVLQQIDNHSCLEESEYKKGLYDGLYETIERMDTL